MNPILHSQLPWLSQRPPFWQAISPPELHPRSYWRIIKYTKGVGNIYIIIQVSHCWPVYPNLHSHFPSIRQIPPLAHLNHGLLHPETIHLIINIFYFLYNFDFNHIYTFRTFKPTISCHTLKSCFK
jgi:hypothetical protein